MANPTTTATTSFRLSLGLLLLLFLVVALATAEKQKKELVRIRPSESQVFNSSQKSELQKVHDHKPRTCSSSCVCQDGGWSTPYGLYCGSNYYSCTGQQPCDGVDYCCGFWWECAGSNALSCYCYQKLYVCSKNMQALIVSGYETSAFCPRYELSASSAIVLGSAFAIPLLPTSCATPTGSDFLFKAYSLFIRKYTSTALLFDYMSSNNLMGDRVEVFPAGSCEDTWDCGVLNVTNVQRSVYGSISIPASTLSQVVPYSGTYELRYLIEDDDYIYWVATSNSFTVTKSS